MLKQLISQRLAGKVALLGVTLASAAATPASAQTVYGLAADIIGTYRVVAFQATAPATFTSNTAITGVASRQVLVGIDSRPATGQVFALGYNTNNSQAQLYTLDVATGAATAVGSPQTLALGTDATRIGFDFNPTADRIRVTGSNGGNFRLNPNDGTIAATDGPLAYASTDANAGQTPSVGSSAYTNSYGGSTTTTLYDIDEDANRLVTQNPPNAGTLNTVGTLGVTVGGDLRVSDLDIASDKVSGQNVAYLSVSTTAADAFVINNQFYQLDLASGATTALGQLGTNSTLSFTFLDMAVGIAGAVTATRPAELATGLSLYPNPLAEAASLHFVLPRAGRVQLLVSDALGRTVSTLEAGPLPAGANTLRWNRTGQAAGLYCFRLQVDGEPAGSRMASLIR